MKIYKETDLDKLVNIMNNDDIIAVPTDTVFGLCARVNSKDSFEKLASTKRRANNNPFPVMCCDEKQINEIGILNENAKKIINAFMPGPITVVLKKRPEVFSYINNVKDEQHDEVAVRMATSNVLKELINKNGSPVFMTSANLSGEPACREVGEVIETFPNIGAVLDGEVSFGESSTIVDCTEDEVKIQRVGPISEEEIKLILER